MNSMRYCSKQYIRQLPEHFGARRSPTWSASADPYWVLHPFLMASQRSRCITRYLPQAVWIKYNIQLEKNIHIARSWQFPLVNEFNITHFILTFRMETDISSTLPASGVEVGFMVCCVTAAIFGTSARLAGSRELASAEMAEGA